MPQKSGYSFRDEPVHVVNMMAAVREYFDCRRCGRNLCEDQFAPLYNLKMFDKRASEYRVNIALHPYCHTCRKQLRGKWIKHPLYKPTLDRFCAKLRSQVIVGARGRGIAVGIDKDDILGLYLTQGGKCALSGIQLDWYEKGFNGRGGRALARPSVDRIDSNGNYVIGNVQIVANIINIMKSDLTTDQFVKLCGMVAEENFTKVLELQTAAA